VESERDHDLAAHPSEAQLASDHVFVAVGLDGVADKRNARVMLGI